MPILSVYLFESSSYSTHLTHVIAEFSVQFYGVIMNYETFSGVINVSF